MNQSASASPDYSILEPFRPILPPRTSIFYQLSLVLVAVVMVGLLLIYLAFVGSLAYGLYYYAVHQWHPIMNMGGSGGRRAAAFMVFKFLLYVIPLFVGAVVLFFMFKPLFAGRPKHARPMTLNPANEPLLYAFIERICESVGAPSPKRIDFDCDLNASAGFRRGFLSMAGNDLVLTLGLPLVANLSARELAGVVAHEFGHFTQSVGMRLSYFIRWMISWFGRVAYRQDAWDEALESWAAESGDIRVMLVLGIAQFCIWFSRCLLKLLMYIGILVAGFLVRQMEYNADAYEINLAGSQCFETTQRKLATLHAAMSATYQMIQSTWDQTGRLPDNLSELVRQAHAQLPPRMLRKIDDSLGFQRTSFFHTHPSPADRIRQARRADAPGIFHDDRPATALFTNFEHTARLVTLTHYQDDVGIPITLEMLFTVHSPQARPAPREAAGDQYFLGVLPLLLPLQIPLAVASSNPEADDAELNQVAGSLRAAAAQVAPLMPQFKTAAQQRLLARAALCLLEFRVAIKAADYELPEVSVEAARTAEADATVTIDSLRRSLHEVAAALTRRMQLGLALRLADRGEYGDEAVAPERIHELVAGLNQKATEFSRQLEILEAIAVLDKIVAKRNSEGETPVLTRALAAQMQLVGAFINAPAETVAAKPGLQLVRRQSVAGPAEVNALRHAAAEWMTEYRSSLDELVEIAKSAEPTPD